MNPDTSPNIFDKLIQFFDSFRHEKKEKTDYREYLVKPLPNGIAFYYSRGGANQIEDWAEAEEVHEICLISGKTRITYRGKRSSRWNWSMDNNSEKDRKNC